MRSLVAAAISVLSTAAALSGCAAPSAGPIDPVVLAPAEQTRFAQIIEGRVAGQPVSCISRIDQKIRRTVGDQLLVYGRSSNAATLYVNDMQGGCRNVDKGALVMRRPQAPLCSGEIAEVVEPTSGTYISNCAFGDFVPYTKLNR